MFAMKPEQEQRERGDDDCQRQTGRQHEKVKAKDVHNDRAKQCEAERQITEDIDSWCANP